MGFFMNDGYEEITQQLAQKAQQSDVESLQNVKADISYVNQQVQVSQLSFKDSYATLSDLQTAFPTGDSNKYAVLADGMIYSWVGGAWKNTKIQANGTGIAEKAVKSINIDDNAVHLDKTNYVESNTNIISNITYADGVSAGVSTSISVNPSDSSGFKVFQFPLNEKTWYRIKKSKTDRFRIILMNTFISDISRPITIPLNQMVLNNAELTDTTFHNDQYKYAFVQYTASGQTLSNLEVIEFSDARFKGVKSHSPERTTLGEVGLLGVSTSNEVVDFNFDNKTITIPPNTSVFHRNKRYFLYGEIINIDTSSIGSGNMGLYFNTVNGTFLLSGYGGATYTSGENRESVFSKKQGIGGNINENHILVAVIYFSHKKVWALTNHFSINNVRFDVEPSESSDTDAQTYTVTNAITNGDFSGGTTSWTAHNSVITASNTVLTVTGDGTGASPKVAQNTNVEAVTNDVYFISAKFTTTSTNAVSMALKAYNDALTGSFLTVASISSPSANTEYILSGVFSVPSGWGTGNKIRLTFEHVYSSAVVATNKVMYLEDVVLINLTQPFTAGNEPSAEYIQSWLTNSKGGWFNGSTTIPYTSEYFKSSEGGAIIESGINPEWSGWLEERLKFGLDTPIVPVPTVVKSPLISEGTIIAGGSNTNMMRWDYHVFEGYASDNKSRITMLVNKHIEEGKPLAELYYYLTAYNHRELAYGWFKIGSDVKKHSFMFNRDKAIAFGSWDFRNVINLARISPSNDLITTYQTVEALDSAYEAENYADENAKGVLYLALKNAQNGAMFYDTDRNEIVIKKNGQWCDMNVTPVANGTYNF